MPPDGGPVTAVTPEQRPVRLVEWAKVFALAIAMIAGAWLLYEMLDVVLLVFLGIILAAALQPWHTQLCQVGVPRGFAVLLIYLLFAALLAGIGILVLPVLLEELGRLFGSVPEQYAALLTWLRDNPSRVLRLVGQRLPPFEALPAAMNTSPADSVRGIFGFTSGLFALFTWVVAVLAVAFYWTLEAPHVERVVLSMLPLTHRTQALGAWREIESKLGGYFRAQGVAMLLVGVASGIGYLLIGLPNPLALAILAGLFEGIPLLGPFLAAVPALLAAIAMGLSPVLLTLGWSLAVQLTESNVLVPRLMSHAVGVSALVSLVAILAFGSVYGILGVLLAVPIAAVVDVLLDRFVLDVDATPASEPAALMGLRRRARALRQRVRGRLRQRSERMGIDPDTPAHVVDAVDHQLEEAVERIASMIRDAQRDGRATDAAERTRMLVGLQRARQRLEQTVSRVDALETAPDAAEDLPVDELEHATTQAAKAVEGAEAVIATLEEPPPAPRRTP
jgi:predicted PurR-regulated permease PerM